MSSLLGAKPGNMTVNEFAQLPASEQHIQELHDGEIVLHKRPNKRQEGRLFRARRALQFWTNPAGILSLHLPFCPLPEYEVRVAHLAFVQQSRWDAAGEHSYFPGSPDWVIEVLNKECSQEDAAAIEAKKQLCLASGCTAFWLVDNNEERVELSTAKGTKTYRRNGHIPLFGLGEHTLSAAKFFV